MVWAVLTTLHFDQVMKKQNTTNTEKQSIEENNQNQLTEDTSEKCSNIKIHSEIWKASRLGKRHMTMT